MAVCDGTSVGLGLRAGAPVSFCSANTRGQGQAPVPLTLVPSRTLGAIETPW